MLILRQQIFDLIAFVDNFGQLRIQFLLFAIELD